MAEERLVVPSEERLVVVLEERLVVPSEERLVVVSEERLVVPLAERLVVPLAERLVVEPLEELLVLLDEVLSEDLLEVVSEDQDDKNAHYTIQSASIVFCTFQLYICQSASLYHPHISSCTCSIRSIYQLKHKHFNNKYYKTFWLL